ncbi:MAG: NAD-dependent protein deacylase [Suipraeoptans sp.]
MLDEKINKLKEIIDDSKNIVFFGDAGVSTESGIPDFRSADGLYNEKGSQIPPEQIISHSFFVSHPDKFYEFYKSKMLYLDAKPNAAHKALSNLEDDGKLSAVVTQNIDGLHQLAGSKVVYELHGSVHRNYCMKCGKFYDAKYIKASKGIPMCECGGMIKPDVVLYEEGLDSKTVSDAVSAIRKADTLIVGGTSLVVYPAAGFLDYFNGENLVVINKGETGRSLNATLEINDKIGEVFEGLNSK